ncbi:endolytic transglycosylase MltG [Cellulomonas fengjieae]|uniref:Endolytic murein transglycosylase n=1 Tax=Cellulomonas fengjieae TaxID=2819978 RepID=A0ABS3SIG5_9CELL|nr:endolytic transglycosylase MltG [Cellulomonas fengjieae]MBO3085538.1 endolytic transglycosylase MltG [Cellulomonas fengjieae]MBO3102646.1 endolytic transglycosylase MltG [Cellulomonas fengjieae]QVI64422.1 endolytic transglycosylase MltG [Cellulomonas fengjieae]
MTNRQTEWWAPVAPTDESHGTVDGESRLAPAEGRPQRARGRAREQRERKRRRRRSIWVLVVAILMVAGAGYVVVSLMGGLFQGADTAKGVEDYSGVGHGAVEVVIKPGDTGEDMAVTLVDAGVVATVKAFNEAFAANPQAASIQPGTYSLLLEMKASDAITELLNPSSRVSFTVTIPEGLTKDQIATKISEKMAVPVEDVKAAIADPAAIGLPAEANGNAEGWLYPATYDIEPDATPAGVLTQMTAQTVAVLTQKGVPQDQWAEVLNKASLVEREARLPEDRPKVARAIENRLAKEMPLQVDATVAYGLGISGMDLTTAMTQDDSNAYNTYRHLGLPPTPIASPGAVSIDAVLNPAPGDWIFWVAINLDTGETRFAVTNDEHNANRELLRQWQAENSG